MFVVVVSGVSGDKVIFFVQILPCGIFLFNFKAITVVDACRIKMKFAKKIYKLSENSPVWVWDIWR